MKKIITWCIITGLTISGTICLVIVLLFGMCFIQGVSSYSSKINIQYGDLPPMNQNMTYIWYDPNPIRSCYVYFKLRDIPGVVRLDKNGAGTYMLVKDSQINSNCVFWTCLYNDLEISK